ncbi:prepilin-type N-terminal cleavage/methylation domain-containing protein [Ilumatobacter fluminis]|uniref:Prepilin-type N-terminal cleavage/methylation domain-containing protein n=1 Tax=Ilumatobacter fluminis TaxID=467091 RepID=A0A4R7HWL8_9ACTN|nr:vWA domain-containing protein [Ilumatobacter fluminis]TDT15190.1 prepilin-type N-terminal cleavage/methylation domain-containing protein [Ilumatobacter fluminis]
MSDPRTGRDRGMTLVELLVTVTLLGLVATVISAALVVTFRTTDSTEGRLTLARSEQSFTTWMPADLASVNLEVSTTPVDDGTDPYGLVSGFVPVDTSATAQPCGTGISCPPGFSFEGDNQVVLRWRTVAAGPTTMETAVSYRLVPGADGSELVRYECSGALGSQATCSSIVVLRNLGTDWSMTTSSPDFEGEGVEYENVAGQQVSVTINGGLGASEELSAAEGGQDTVTLTAGGVSMGAISSSAPTGSPSFVREPSRCGGPIVIMVDDSNSIGTAAMGTVRTSVRAFIEEFRGTPVQLQVVEFGTWAQVLGNGTTGNGYYDMSESSEVDAVKAQINSTNLSGNSGSAGGTNWEHAWYRALVNDGKPGDQVTPDTVVFFTDGVPTYYVNSSGNLGGSGSSFTYTNWAEAEAVAAPFRRATPPSIIGVGVNGPDNGLNNTQYFDPPGNYNATYKTGRQILAQLVDGTDSGVQYNGSNAEQANLYLLDGFGGLTEALKTVALKDCGGTLTIRTRIDSGGDGQKFQPEVVYENVGETSEGGATRTVATSGSFPTGTFDFELASSSVTTEVVPQISSALAGYRLSRWECRAGPTTLAASETDIEGVADFKGVEVTLGANQAASCTMWVVPK